MPDPQRTTCMRAPVRPDCETSKINHETGIQGLWHLIINFLSQEVLLSSQIQIRNQELALPLNLACHRSYVCMTDGDGTIQVADAKSGEDSCNMQSAARLSRLVMRVVTQV